jgi:hypothetical protein
LLSLVSMTGGGYRARRLDRPGTLVGDLANGAHDSIKVVPEFDRGHPHDPKAAPGHPRVAFGVMDPLVTAMRGPINLDDQGRVMTIEVGDIWPERVLTTKAVSAEASLA